MNGNFGNGSDFFQYVGRRSTGDQNALPHHPHQLTSPTAHRSFSSSIPSDRLSWLIKHRTTLGLSTLAVIPLAFAFFRLTWLAETP